MENPGIETQEKYLRKISRELGLLNIFVFIGFVTFAVFKIFEWIS